jgi:hypothetical protein
LVGISKKIRPAAVCSVPCARNGSLAMPLPPVPPPPPPTEKFESALAVLRAPSRAVTFQTQVPALKPETVADQTSPVPLVAEKLCDVVVPLEKLKDTLLTPTLSVTFTLKVMDVPRPVAPFAGLREPASMTGSIVSPPGAAIGVAPPPASVAMRRPCRRNVPSGSRR